MKNEIIVRILESRHDLLPQMNQRPMSRKAYTRIVIDATKEVIKDMVRWNVDLYDIQDATKKEGGNYHKAFVELYGTNLKY